MNITKKEQKEVTVIVDVICNRCGNSCKTDCGNIEGLISANVSGGYDVSAYYDGDCFNFSLCQFCVKELMDTFKHPALVSNTFDSYTPLCDEESEKEE